MVIQRILQYAIPLLFLLPLSSSAQVRLDFSPKTPEAAAIDRVRDVPVSMYTGNMDFSIPITTITNGDIQVPISLDYQGQAIRVDQEATWVGLNWLLSAGGAVTTRLPERFDGFTSTQFQEDWDNLCHLSLRRIYPYGEFPNLYYKVDGMHPDWRGGYGRNWFSKSSEVYEYRNSFNDLSYSLYHYVLDKNGGNAPTYHAVFLGNVIDFIWDRSKKEFFITGKKQNFSISGDCYGGPVITDGKGMKYKFSQLEIAYPEGDQVDLQGGKALDYTFYLSSIESPDGRSVKFVYSYDDMIKTQRKVEETLYESTYPLSGLRCYNYVGNANGASLAKRMSPLYIFHHAVRLTSIETPSTVVKFNASRQRRKDIDGTAYSLDNTEVYSRTSNGLVLRKRHKFEYSYFGRDETGGNTLKDYCSLFSDKNMYDVNFPHDDFMYCRLRLDRIYEESGNAKDNVYSFYYKGGTLPCKASASVDYWGYFNGKENLCNGVHTLIPRSFNEPTKDGVYDCRSKLVYYGADRRPDINYTDMGMLSTIVYPTGGSSNIRYEPNSFTNYIYLDSKRESSTLTFRRVGVYASNQPRYSMSNLYNHLDTVFYVDHEGYYNLAVTYTLGTNAKAEYLIGHNTVLERLEQRGGTGIIAHRAIAVMTCDSVDAKSTVRRMELYLNAGKYRLFVNNLQNKDIPLQSFVSVQARLDVSNRRFETLGAGLRVRSVSQSNDMGDTVRTCYTYNDASGVSSGILMSPAIFARKKLLVYQESDYIAPNGTVSRPFVYDYCVASGDNMVINCPLVGYGNVSVRKEGKGQNNGCHKYAFWNKDWTSLLTEYMLRVDDPRNGSVVTDSVFDNKGRIVKVTANSSKWVCTDSRMASVSIDNIYIGPSGVTRGGLVSSNAYADALDGGCMQIYMYPSAQFAMVSSSSEETDYVGGVKRTTTTSTQYNLHNCQDSVVSIRLPEGKTMIRETYYPSDCATTSSRRLASLKITDVPIEVLESAESSEGTFVVSDTRYGYNMSGQLSALYEYADDALRPRSSFALSKDMDKFPAYRPTAHIEYGASGMPRAVTDEMGNTTVYVWGYCCEYPIAVVKNTTVTDMMHALGGVSKVDSMESSSYPQTGIDDMYKSLAGIKGAIPMVFSYSPGIGMVETMAPNGERQSYTYDQFNRLSSIIDHNGIVSETFKYYIKNQ